jgi:hypothetical protein
MKKILIILLGVSTTICAQGIVEMNPNKKEVVHPIRSIYSITGGEFIFSFSRVTASGLLVDNKLRVSLFPHLQQQFHYNFNNNFGILLGASMANIGLRGVYTTENLNTSFELRQRALALGIPLALKIGKMEEGNYAALGFSAEFMTHYKSKFYLGGEKIKYTEWFSEKVNLFNPSIFLDLRNEKGGYIRFRYYLYDFLTETSTYYANPLSSTFFTFTPQRSTVFYISFGSTFMKKKKPKKMTLKDV